VKHRVMKLISVIYIRVKWGSLIGIPLMFIYLRDFGGIRWKVVEAPKL
jgi:hypothetical protein